MNAKILVFSGSVRTGSYNTQLAKAAVKTLAAEGAQVNEISLVDYPLPIVDADLLKSDGAPLNAVKLAQLFQAHDGLFIACPEYNSSITPLLKNVLDWVSLTKTDGTHDLKPYAGLTVALGAASPGALGGIRGLYHVRSVLMNVGAQVITSQCSVAHAAHGFAEDGMPSEERTVSLLKKTCRSLLEQVTVGRGRD